VDINLVYGVLTAGTAISSGFAGTQAARLSKKAVESAIALGEARAGHGSVGVNGMWKDLNDAVAERCAGAQTASAWLATATALFGVASTRTVSDVMGVSFLFIGAVLAVLAARALLAAEEATTLISARAAFEEWYPTWIKGRNSAASRPTDEEIAFAFAEGHKKYAAKLRYFQIWPFHWAGYKDLASHFSRAR
jgi:hypothetical protein